MGIADRLARYGVEKMADRMAEEAPPAQPMDDKSRAIVAALNALLAPFMDPNDGMSVMLSQIASRYMGDASPEQLQAVVDQLCYAAEQLAPYRSTETQEAAGADT